MIKYSKEQKIFDIAGLRIGGQPGELATTLIGSMFYYGHNIVRDDRKGDFDEQAAEALIKRQEEYSDRTGNPCLIDVVCAWPETVIKYVDFVADHIDGPLVMDGTTEEVRIVGLKHVKEVGLQDRIILDSINPEIKQREIDAIRESGVTSAILLVFNQENPWIEGKLELMRGTPTRRSLLSICEEAGVTKPLVDTVVIDIIDPGPSSKAIQLIKEEFGLPCGCGAHNALFRYWQAKKPDKEEKLATEAVCNATPILMGANFLLYGPMEGCSHIFPAMGLLDSYVAYVMKSYYKIRPPKDHPLYRVAVPTKAT